MKNFSLYESKAVSRTSKEAVVEVDKDGKPISNLSLADELTQLDPDLDYQIRLDTAYNIINDPDNVDLSDDDPEKLTVDDMCEIYDLDPKDLENYEPSEEESEDDEEI